MVLIETFPNALDVFVRAGVHALVELLVTLNGRKSDMCATDDQLVALFGTIEDRSESMARCACVSCNSCTCACSCRSIPEFDEILVDSNDPI